MLNFKSRSEYVSVCSNNPLLVVLIGDFNEKSSTWYYKDKAV